MKDPRRFKHVNCLVIEDIPSQLDAMKRILDGRFDQCFYATNGIEGLNILMNELHGKEQFLIVTDYRMPDMDAGEMLEKLHRICDGIALPIPPILMITAYECEGKETLADALICKPANDRQILDEIERLLHLKGFSF